MKRRDFLKNALGAIALATCGGLAGKAASPAEKEQRIFRADKSIEMGPVPDKPVVVKGDNYVAYTIPHKKVPAKEEVKTPKLPDVGGAVDFMLEHASDARWDIVARAMDVMEQEFARKREEEAWKMLLASV